MQVLRAEQHRAMRWKNGGGITYEIASFPPADQALDGFDWRVSMAQVETDGPFSMFPGIDRTLAIVEGAGLLLSVGDAAEITIAGDSEPHSFAADVPTSSRLVSGPVTDLNVMTRRGKWQHGVGKFEFSGILYVEFAEITLLVVRRGTVSMTCEKKSYALSNRDAVLFHAKEDAAFNNAETAEVFRIDLWRV